MAQSTILPLLSGTVDSQATHKPPRVDTPAESRAELIELAQRLTTAGARTTQLVQLIASDVFTMDRAKPLVTSEQARSLESKKVSVLHVSFVDQPTLFSIACDTSHKVLSFAQAALTHCLLSLQNEHHEVKGVLPSILSSVLSPILHVVSSLLDRTHTESVEWQEILTEFERCGTLTGSQKAFLEKTEQKNQVAELLKQLNYQLIQTPHQVQSQDTLKEILVTRFLDIFQKKEELQGLLSPKERALFTRLSHAQDVLCDKTVLYYLLKKASLYEWCCHTMTLFNVPCTETIKKGFREAIKKEYMKGLSDILKATISKEKIDQMDLPQQVYFQETIEFLSSSDLTHVSEFIAGEKEVALLLTTAREIKHSMKRLYTDFDVEPRIQDQLHNLDVIFDTIQKRGFDRLIDAKFGTLNQWSHRAALLGTVKRTFMRAASYFHDFSTQTEEHKKTTRVSSLWCNHGGGHKSLTEATRPYLEAPTEPIDDRRFSVIDMDLPKVVRAHMDPIYKIASIFGCSEVDAPKVFNWLLVNDHCNIYMFLKSLGLKKPSEEAIKASTSIIRKALLQAGSDLFQMNYTFDNLYIDGASRQLGIPLAHINSDIDNSGWDFTPTNPHFRVMTQSKTNPKIRGSIGFKIKEEDIIEMGLPVGRDFDQLPAEETLASFKRDVLGIHDGRKIIVFTNGANGTISPLPELLATQYHDHENPLAIVVVCGRNEELKKHMESHVRAIAEKNGSSVSIIPLGFQKKDAMAKLYRLSSCVVGKPGGLTTMECLKAGTRFIADCTKPRFPWEKFNSDIVEESGRGTHIEKNEDLLAAIQQQLEASKEPPTPQAFTQIDAGLAMERGLLDLVRKAELSDETRLRKKTFLRFAKQFAAIQA